MRIFGLFLLVFSLQSQASTTQCQLTEPVTVHLVGEIHGTQTSAELQSVLIPGALKDKIVMGIEIDPATLALKLNPRFANSLIAMEEPVSKGFALVMWAWRSVTWTKIKFEVGFARTYQNSAIQDAISSFAYFLGHYPQLQEAVKSARLATLDADAKSDPDLKAILDKTDQIIAKPLEIDQAEILLPVTSLNSLTTLNRFFQEVMRAYIISLKQDKPRLDEFGISIYLDSALSLLNYKKLEKGSASFGIDIYTYDHIYRSMEAALLFNWRSDQMAKAIVSHLCHRQQQGLGIRPFVAVAGSGHLSQMEKRLEAVSTKIYVTLSVPPSNHSDFDKLYQSLKK